MEMTLNTVARNRHLMWVGIAVVSICLVAYALFCIVDPTFAAGTEVGSGETVLGKTAYRLLGDLGLVVALCGLGAGIFQIIKGRTVIGIVIAVVAALLIYFCKNPNMLAKLGEALFGILNMK